MPPAGYATAATLFATARRLLLHAISYICSLDCSLLLAIYMLRLQAVRAALSSRHAPREWRSALPHAFLLHASTLLFARLHCHTAMSRFE